MTLLLVLVGGAVGALGRHGVTVLAKARLGATTAGATLTVNAAGSLLLGLVAGWVIRSGGPDWVLALVGVGFCGAFTTFSSHAIEVATAAREGRLRHALADLALSLALGASLAWLGWAITT